MRKPTRVDLRVERARGLRREMTEAEKMLWQNLRQPPFKTYHFRRQATIGPFFADFASHDLRLIIELDGGQHDNNRNDEHRTLDLNNRGYRVIRFWNNDVLRNREGVLQFIENTIVQIISAPHPRPLPAASGGRGEAADPSPQGGGESAVPAEAFRASKDKV